MDGHDKNSPGSSQEGTGLPGSSKEGTGNLSPSKEGTVKAGFPKGRSGKPRGGADGPGPSGEGAGRSGPPRGKIDKPGSLGAIPRGTGEGQHPVGKNRSGAAKRRARSLRLQGQSHSSPKPDTQAQGGTRGAGAKRFRSDGSTPGSDTGRPARKRGRTVDPRTASYAQAVTADLRVAITSESHPEGAISEGQFNLVRASLNEAIDAIEEGGTFPKFEGFRWLPQGAIAVSCGDQWTLEWLERTTPLIKPWEGAKLITQRRIPKVIKMVAIINGSADDTDTILKRLRRQNPGLRTNLWRSYFRREEPNRVLLVLGADEASAEALERQNYKAYAGVSTVTFKVKGTTAGPVQVEAPPAGTSGDAGAVEGDQIRGDVTAPPQEESSRDSGDTADVVTELMALVGVGDTPQGPGTGSPEEAGGSP